MAAPARLAPPNADALSTAFDNVYWTVAVRPLRKRRRTWNWPACRDELPFDVRYTNPEGHAGQGFGAPDGNVLGRNCCISLLPFVPRYVAITLSEWGSSCCI